MKRTALHVTCISVALFGATTEPRDAHACGGTFCDTGPNVMPVDQTGENVLFVVKDGKVEAHVQIQYTGDPARFAWIVPMPKVPEVEVGSQPLFDALLQGTVPSYGYSSTFDQCNDPSDGLGGPTNGGAGQSGSGGSGGGPGGGPVVVLKKTVGAFEVEVLEGGTAPEVSNWLSLNGYQDIPSAPSILAGYVDQGFVFAVFKLTGGAGLDELHPVILRYDGDEPCVPLQLTAVAAVQDMGVRTFFLGDGRVVPTNYKHVTLNPLKLDWVNFASNYAEAVSNAADSPIANGRAFVTEYAGPSNLVSAMSVDDPRRDPSIFLGIDPTLVMDELRVQGIVDCQTYGCTYFHPLAQALVEEYLPRPAGVTPEEFYSCLSCYANRIDLTAWDSAKFTADYAERIVQPGRHAATLLAENDYLTRMYTTISPAEMTADPIFHVRADLPDVPLPTIATRRVLCDSDEVYTLPDEREVALATPGTWPAFGDQPWVEIVEEIPLSGPPIVLVDNTEQIDGLLAESNEANGWPAKVPTSSGGTSGLLGGGPNAPSSSPTGGGCACRTSASRDALAGALLSLGAVGLVLARRRRRA